jgi:hypothetical protein
MIRYDIRLAPVGGERPAHLDHAIDWIRCFEIDAPRVAPGILELYASSY